MLYDHGDVPLRVKLVSAPGDYPPPAPVALVGEMIGVGRLPRNDLVIPPSALSVGREHAVFRRISGSWCIVDQSVNGTSLNGEFLHNAASGPLKAGDLIVLGEVTLCVEFDDQRRVSNITGAKPIFTPTEDRTPGYWPEPVSLFPSREPSPDDNRVAGGNASPEAHLVPVPDPVPDPARGRGQSMTAIMRAIEEKLAQRIRAPDDDRADQTESVGPGPWVPTGQQNALPIETGPAPPVEAAPAPPVATEGGDTTTDLLEAFLGGAGLKQLPPGLDAATAMRALGESTRVLVQAMADILEARRKLKHMFRIRQTYVDRAGNNPLKFAVDDQEMLLALLGNPRPGFLTGGEAVTEAARDLMRHQIAVVEGFRAVIDAIFGRLSPDRIDATGKPRNRLLPGDAFKERYIKAYGDLREDFGEMLSGRLGQIFAETYEQHAPTGDPAVRGGR